MKEYPVLYKKSKKDKISSWKVYVDNSGEFPVIYRESGFVGFKIRTTRRVIKKGVNVGKSNEKTPYENACFISDNYYAKHIEDNYIEDIEDIDKPVKYLKPMLAKPYKKVNHFPVYIQPKYNGIRGSSFRHTGDIRLISRERKEFPALSHIRKSFDIFFDYSPDGEIYHHDLTFQEIVRRTKKYREGLTEELQYYIYDLAIPDMIFTKRIELIRKLVSGSNEIIKIVPTILVNSNEEIQKYHDKFVKDGFEGIIIRDPDSMYGFNDRPSCLQKYKEFIDKEFIVIDYDKEEWDDNGTIRNLVIWICTTKEGHRFNVRPKGSFLERERKYNIASEYINKELTVRYQEESENGTPIFGVGLSFRDYE